MRMGKNPRESGRHGKNRGDMVVMGSVTISLSSCSVAFLSSMLNTCVCVCIYRITSTDVHEPVQL